MFKDFFNPLTTNVPRHMETSQFISFYISTLTMFSSGREREPWSEMGLQWSAMELCFSFFGILYGASLWLNTIKTYLQVAQKNIVDYQERWQISLNWKRKLNIYKKDRWREFFPNGGDFYLVIIICATTQH